MTTLYALLWKRYPVPVHCVGEYVLDGDGHPAAWVHCAGNIEALVRLDYLKIKES